MTAGIEHNNGGGNQNTEYQIQPEQNAATGSRTGAVLKTASFGLQMLFSVSTLVGIADVEQSTNRQTIPARRRLK